MVKEIQKASQTKILRKSTTPVASYKSLKQLRLIY